MENKTAQKPTEAELEILQILWMEGPSTVKTVNEIQNKSRDVGYTTTLKFMQIMTEKKLLERSRQGKSHIYKPAVQKEMMQGRLLNSLVESAFGGSAAKLVMQALGNHEASKEEIRQIRDLLKKIDKEGKQ